MLAKIRLEKILEFVEKKRSVTIQELMELLRASESTIRRDLNNLDSEGKLIKVYGGAVAAESTFSSDDSDVEIRMHLKREEKIRIAKCAAAMINDSDFVFLDAGTTTECMIDYIAAKNAVFVTNAVSHAKKLAKSGVNVYLIGGQVKATTEAIVGSEALADLDKYNFTIGFFGSNGVSRSAGFTTPDSAEAHIKRKAMAKCTQKRIVVCDSSKFNNICPITFAPFESAQIITDRLEDSSFSDCKNIKEVDNVI